MESPLQPVSELGRVNIYTLCISCFDCQFTSKIQKGHYYIPACFHAQQKAPGNRTAGLQQITLFKCYLDQVYIIRDFLKGYLSLYLIVRIVEAGDENLLRFNRNLPFQTDLISASWHLKQTWFLI